MGDSNSLIKIELGDYSKPVNTLIEKISNGIAGYFQPYQIKRIANAEAEANKIHAVSQIKITELQKRAMTRFFSEEAKKQNNIEEIIRKAIPEVSEQAKPDQIEDDWITHFFDKCRIVSNEDMQQLWSRVLSGEANSPGSFSRKTVNLLADLNREDALLFTNLCRFCWKMGVIYPLIFDVKSEVYIQQGINFNTLSNIENLGLIKFDDLAGFARYKLPKKITVSYFGKNVEITFPKDVDNKLELGKVLLSRVGEQLFSVCKSTPIDEYFSFVYDRWASKSLVPKSENQQEDSAES
ncbi:DUF2806 domain-containing protein [Candidatus Latescibacterota bacterium]